jgi:hypothetical protein
VFGKVTKPLRDGTFHDTPTAREVAVASADHRLMPPTPGGAKGVFFSFAVISL